MQSTARAFGLAVVAALLLVGCGKHYWNKPGAGAEDFAKDSSECARANAMYMSTNKEYGIVLEDAYKSCLRMRGWNRAQHHEPPADWFRGIETEDPVRLDGPVPAAALRSSSSVSWVQSSSWGMVMTVPSLLTGLAQAIEGPHVEDAHRSFGTLPWRDLFQPAIDLARNGVELNNGQAYLHAILDLILRHTPESRAVYERNGERLVVEDTLVQTDLAATLELLAEEGGKVMYEGELAAKISEHVRAHGGCITKEDLDQGENMANLPAGEAFVVPDVKSGDGTIVFDQPIAWLGRWIRGVRVAFDGGRMTKFSASENEDLIRSEWAEATGPKDLLGYLDIGLNPNARSGFLQDAIVAGNVYVAVGANDEVPGGKNKTDFYLGGSLTGANVTIDGREVIRSGNLTT